MTYLLALLHANPELIARFESSEAGLTIRLEYAGWLTRTLKWEAIPAPLGAWDDTAVVATLEELAREMSLKTSQPS